MRSGESARDQLPLETESTPIRSPDRRRSKIVATLGPSTDGRVSELHAAGADCARLNCSHSEIPELRRRAAEAREAGLPILFDLQGPKIRLSDIETRSLDLGEELDLTGPGGRESDVRVELDDFLSLLSERSEIVFGDGAPRLEIIDLSDRRARCRVKAAGEISSRKGVFVTESAGLGSQLSEKDIDDLRLAVELESDFVALSFVRSAEDVRELRERLDQAGSGARLIAKIEKVEAYSNLSEILEIADGVMIARGDYGVEAGFAAVPLMQKDAIERANRQGKLVITATQMLESMIHSSVPTRAEATDVANAVFEGTSAVMLSGETAVGEHPIEAVRAMSELIGAAEQHPSIYCHFIGDEDLREHPASAVMHAAVTLGRDVDAAAIVVPTSSGDSARAAAKYKPKRPIVALTPSPRVLRQLQLEWGVYPTLNPKQEQLDDLIAGSVERAKQTLSELRPGDLLVVSSGPKRSASGQTNLISLQRVG